MGGGSGPAAVQNGEWIEAVGVRYPAGPTRGYTGEPPAHVIAAAQLGFLGDEQTQKFAAYVAETNDREIIGRNGLALSESVRRRRREFCRGGRDQRGFVLQNARDNDDGFVGLFPLFQLNGFADSRDCLDAIAGVKTRGVELVLEPRAIGESLDIR